MTDTTKDIWNDDDGEEKRRRSRRRSHRLRRFLLFFTTLAVVLGAVLLAAWRDGTGIDILRRYFAYGGEDTGGRFHYDASAANRFAPVGEGLVVLSGTSLQVMDKSGETVWSASVNMKSPAIATGGGWAVAYDVGGTELYVLGPDGLLAELTASEDGGYIAASLNEEGWLAVTSEKRGYKGTVTVYDDPREDPVFVFDSSDRFVIDACVTDDCKTLAAVTLGQESGTFVSNVVLYSLEKAGKVDPIGDYDITDGLVAAIAQQDGMLVTVSDTVLTCASDDGEIQGSYSYGEDFLREFSIADGFTALLLNRYQAGSVGRLVTVDTDGAEIAALDVNEEILDLSAAGRYLAVLYTDTLVIYNRDLQVYATLEGTENAREVLVRTDGSALLIGSEWAELFLP